VKRVQVDDRDIDLDMSFLNAGTYFVKLKLDSNTKTIKFVKL